MRERSLRTFLLVGLAMALPALVAVWRMDRFTLHLTVNNVHNALLDALFPVITAMANGWVPVGLSVVLLAFSWRSFLMMGLCTGLSAILVQFLKQVVFPGHDRPSMFLDHMPGLPLVAGLDLHHHFSFPSGHSTAAFSMCLALAVVVGRPLPAALLALAAGLMAYSRVYLSQHFTEDILAGAFLGCATGTMVYFLLYRGPWSFRTGLDRSPLRRKDP